MFDQSFIPKCLWSDSFAGGRMGWALAAAPLDNSQGMATPDNCRDGHRVFLTRNCLPDKVPAVLPSPSDVNWLWLGSKHHLNPWFTGKQLIKCFEPRLAATARKIENIKRQCGIKEIPRFRRESAWASSLPEIHPKVTGINFPPLGQQPTELENICWISLFNFFRMITLVNKLLKNPQKQAPTWWIWRGQGRRGSSAALHPPQCCRQSSWSSHRGCRCGWSWILAAPWGPNSAAGTAQKFTFPLNFLFSTTNKPRRI